MPVAASSTASSPEARSPAVRTDRPGRSVDPAAVWITQSGPVVAGAGPAVGPAVGAAVGAVVATPPPAERRARNRASASRVRAAATSPASASRRRR